MPNVTLQSIFQIGYEAFESGRGLPRHVSAAARAIVACRTALLGGHIQACPDGHYQRQWYNSCKHRICPLCAWIQIERWLLKRKARLLACDHYHGIFTLPHELCDLWLSNVKAMTDLLFRAVRDTLFELLGDEEYLGGLPGMILALHTWSQTLILHPHVHCLITGGGLRAGGEWRFIDNGFLLPVRVVMSKFRGKILAYLDKAIEDGKVDLPEGMSPQRWKNLKNKLGRVKWNVNIRQRYEHGNGVLSYLGRYVRGGPISNERIISCEDGKVKFRYRVNGEGSGSKKRDTMTLAVEQFIGRYLLHVPERLSKLVRYYGLYNPHKEADLEKCMECFDQELPQEEEFLDWQSYCEGRGEEHPELCPVCGKRLICLSMIPSCKTIRPSEELFLLKEAA
jgi:hypothetical protein